MTTPRVPVLRQQQIKAWPKHEEGGRAAYTPILDALTKSYPFDAHTAQYSAPQKERRIDLGVLTDEDALKEIGGGLSMWGHMFDIDCATSHKALGGAGNAPAPDEWWVAELEKIDRLRVAHPGLFIYRTRGGYRIVGLLAQFVVLASKADAEGWTRRYLELVAYLRRAFAIVADPIKDATRLVRLPHATRDGADAPERREVVGDPADIGVWTPEITDEDRAEAERLAKRKEPKRRERKPRGGDKVYSGEGVLFHALQKRGAIRQQLEPGKWAIDCPRAAEHSKDSDTGTVLWAPGEGEEIGYIHCSHSGSGHDRLTLRDWLREFSEEELSAARTAAGLGEKEPAGDGGDLDLLTDDQNRARKCVANLLTIMSLDPSWQRLLAYDEFRECVVCTRPPPCRAQDAPAQREGNEWAEEDSTRTAAWILEHHGVDTTSGMVDEAVRTVAHRQRVHPVRDWMRSLTWDGVPRVAKLFVDYFGAADTPYARGIAVCWLVSFIARTLQPGCQADYLVVLESPQGFRKTTGLEALVGKDLYADTGLDLGDKDSVQCLRGKLLYAFDELDGISGKAALARVKNFLSRRVDNIRPSYGRRNRDFPRRCIFAATTNEAEYLQDRTGNRRFWPVRCGQVNVDGLRRDRGQLFAEAVALYDAQTKWWPDAALERLCRGEQEARLQHDPWRDLIDRWLQRPVRPTVDYAGHPSVEAYDDTGGILGADVLVYALGKRPGDCSKQDEMRVAAVLRELGYERGERRTEGGERVRRFVRTTTKGGPAGGPTGGPGVSACNGACNAYGDPPGPPNVYPDAHAGTRARTRGPVHGGVNGSGGPGGPGGPSAEYEAEFSWRGEA